MKKIGMIGTHLIHTYAYAMHFNEADMDFVRKAKTAPAWQVELMKKNTEFKPLQGAEISHIWGGLEGSPEDMAGTFGLTVAKSLDEVFDNCDLIMIMDEQIPSRSELIEKALNARKHVFVDKLLSDNLDTTERLIDLSEQKGVELAGWSQLGFCPEYNKLQTLPKGGVAHIVFRMTPEILIKYGIHLISAMQGSFPGKKELCGDVFKNNNSIFVPLKHGDGTTIIISCGPDYPSFPVGARIDYFYNEQAVLIETTDYCGAFRNAAESIIAMLNGNAPRFTKYDLLEASKLLDLICN